MKVRYIFSTVVLALCLFASCYEDKGNYDYMVMNDINVEAPMDQDEFALGDVVKVNPELTFATGVENTDLAYKWTFDGHDISNEKNLVWTADTIATYAELQLAVLDKKTGVTYFASNLISIVSPYVREGWLVLSEKDNASMLTYMRRKTVDGKLTYDVTRDIYKLINKESLGGKPSFMSVHFVSRWDSEDNTSWVWLVQKGGLGCVDISGSSYQYQGKLDQMFLEKEYPKGFYPKYVVDMFLLTLTVGEDGTIYSRVKENELLFNSGYFLNRPLTFKGNNIDGSQLVIAPFYEHGGMLLYDKNSSNYLHVCDYKSWNGKVYSGQVLPLTVDEKEYQKLPNFARLDNMKDYKVHFTGAYKTDDWYGNMCYMSILEKNGTFYLQNFAVESFGNNSMTVVGASPISQDQVPFGSIISGTSKNVFTLCRYQDESPFLLLSRDNDLYLYYLKGEVLVKYASFDAPVTSLDAENAWSRHLGVGLENGEFYVLNLDVSVVEEVIKTGDSKDKILFQDKDYGNIIQVRYKNQNGNDWADF